MPWRTAGRAPRTPGERGPWRSSNARIAKCPTGSGSASGRRGESLENWPRHQPRTLRAQPERLRVRTRVGRVTGHTGSGRDRWFPSMPTVSSGW
ncbi:hypothetical protein ACFFX0_27160 [Citricoccus parietis]|uniref:Uncharacterized protein n=1 Tax=Citricoccus parietis TaxID=592307 RepID=A0ABV5G8C5_9MICC